MIHTILVGPATEVGSLKKEMRKRLMTGGAVIRLQEEIDAEALGILIERFSQGAEAYGVQSMVLEEVAKHPELTEAQLEALRSLRLSTLDRVLAARSAGSQE